MWKFEHVWNMNSGQDGTIFGDYVFRFDAKGFCNVYSMAKQEKISSFVLGGLDVLVPHSNAVCFGAEYYEESDEFPLLYSNIYNNYSKMEDRLEGVCCVYRLTRDGLDFCANLVQIIKIGFVENTDYWKSLEGTGDVRPYGNFVVDAIGQKLHAFVMRDKESVTRYFSFALPKLADGEMSETFGVKTVTLALTDIQAQFDCEYSRFIQGACCRENKIYSVEGFSDATNPAKMRIINLEKQIQEEVIDLFEMGLTIEPEFVDFYGDELYYSDAKGSVYHFTKE